MILLLALTLAATPPAAKVNKETFPSAGVTRTVYTFVPDQVVGKPAPVIITLHGSGRDGRILVDNWKSLAEKEGIILAGLDATVRDGWHLATDGPNLLRDLVEYLKKHSIDPRRVYLFGHSAGAIHGLGLGVLESEYFAAVAVHAGVLFKELGAYAKDAPRKIPVALWVGTNDRFFPLEQVRATRDALKAFGYPVELTEIPGHTHDYYGRSSQINKEVWAFLQQHRLAADPKFQVYEINK